MLISVIIASYRRPRQLCECLTSLVNQSRPPDQVIVVTKAHDPESAQAAQAFVHERQPSWEFKSIQVVENNVKTAENAGLREATGDIVCFIDDDAVARPDWIERLLVHYDSSTVGAVGGRDLLYIDGKIYTDGQPGRVGELTWYGRMYGNHHLGADGVCDVYFLKGVNMSLRRRLVAQIDPCLVGEINYHWEDDLCLAVRAQGYRVLYDPSMWVDHYAGRSMEARTLEDPHTLFENNHNATYVLLKYLPWPRKVIAFLYSFLIGYGNLWGIGSILRQIMLAKQKPTFIRVLGPSLSGKLQGAWHYMRYVQFANMDLG